MGSWSFQLAEPRTIAFVVSGTKENPFGYTYGARVFAWPTDSSTPPVGDDSYCMSAGGGRVQHLAAGSYRFNVLMDLAAPTWGFTSKDVTDFDFNFTDMRISEEEGGLEVSWKPAAALLDLCTHGTEKETLVSWYRNGYRVGTQLVPAKADGAFIDGLTVGVKYRVTVSSRYNGYLPRQSDLEGTGTPRIPSALLVQSPRTVLPRTPFPVEVSLTDRRGRPVADAKVSLQYSRNRVEAAGGPSANSARTLKSVRTNRKGLARTKVRLSKSGYVRAVFRASGKYADSLKARRIRVRR